MQHPQPVAAAVLQVVQQAGPSALLPAGCGDPVHCACTMLAEIVFGTRGRGLPRGTVINNLGRSLGLEAEMGKVELD